MRGGWHARVQLRHPCVLAAQRSHPLYSQHPSTRGRLPHTQSAHKRARHTYQHPPTHPPTRVALPHKLLPVGHRLEEQAAAKQRQAHGQRGGQAQASRDGRAAAVGRGGGRRGGGSVSPACQASVHPSCNPRPAPLRHPACAWSRPPERVCGGDRQQPHPGPQALHGPEEGQAQRVAAAGRDGRRAGQGQ